MTKVQMTVADLIALLDHARKIGTVDNWIGCAVQWIEGAEEEIERQDTVIAKQAGEIVRLTTERNLLVAACREIEQAATWTEIRTDAGKET